VNSVGSQDMLLSPYLYCNLLRFPFGYLTGNCSRHAKGCCLRICQDPATGCNPEIPAWICGYLL